MGDHDRYMKSVPYRGSVHIPLVISGPGVRQGAVCDEMVQLHDIAATITDFAGLSMPDNCDSCSLRPLATDEYAEPVRDYQVSILYNSLKFGKPYPGYEDLMDCCKLKPDNEYIQEFCQVLGLTETKASMTKFSYSKDWFCIMNKRYKLIEFEDAEPELYDMENDPEEQKNIAEGNKELMESLRALYKMRPIQQD